MKNTMKKYCFLSRTILIILLLVAGISFAQAEENTDNWEVEIIKKATSEVVKSGLVQTNSFSLEGLEFNVEYFAKVRTKNTFRSDWEVSDVFMLEHGLLTTNTLVIKPELRLSSDNGLLHISSDALQKINIYTVEGYLLRSISLPKGDTTVSGLVKGLYIINGQKILVK